MMTRAWLILADILVLLFLLFSFVLFFLYQPEYIPPKQPTARQTLPPQIVSSQTDESNCSLPVLPEGNVTLSVLKELNVSREESEAALSLEEILQLSQEVSMQEYLERNTFQYVSLKARLKALDAQKGDRVFIRIFKEEALLEVWIETLQGYRHLKDYPICDYSGHLGPKLKEGDRQAPEGFYRVYPSQLNPHSRFHLAFNLGYPNAYDRAHHHTGSYLMVHGDCRSVGCYAMTDEKIEEIYGLVDAALKHGQPYVPVHIFPFRMEDEAMDAHTESRWYEFWMMLKEGYDYFEAEERPPLVEVQNGRYVIMETAD